MVATSLLKIMKQLLRQLRSDHPNLTFAAGEAFVWSPDNQTVFYNSSAIDEPTSQWSLLHEVSHGILNHTHYRSDFELIKLEVEAWDYANVLGDKYGVQIDQDHVQDCLDTYRDWLHRRSTCPTCNTVSAQSSTGSYSCLNCGATWNVSKSRFCRPYRKVARN